MNWRRMALAIGTERSPGFPGLTILLLSTVGCVPVGYEIPLFWPMRTVDNSSAGADGIRLADVNGDGLLDATAAWEEGGLIRVYLNPGTAKVRSPWPAVTVGQVGSPEDAVFVDLDNDGSTDVVSSCEGKVRTIFFHWAPADATRYLDPTAWRTEALPASKGQQQWMFCLPMQIDGKHGVDLAVGGKNDKAQIGWFEAPADARDLNAWKWHPLYEAGWIMSLTAEDVDGDGDLDIVASDRKGPSRGCLWLENPGTDRAAEGPWPIHRIGGGDREYMFLTVADLDGDGLRDVLAATAGRELVYYRRTAARPPAWESHIIQLPESTGTGKGVAVADLNEDGRQDIVFSCEHADGRRGLMWMQYLSAATDRRWLALDIGGGRGAKFDLVQLADVDGDGDLDVLTTEEVQRLGVVWYENTIKTRMTKSE